MSYEEYVRNLHDSVFGTKYSRVPSICSTLERKTRSGGRDRDLARGRRRGPRGIPCREKFEEEE